MGRHRAYLVPVLGLALATGPGCEQSDNVAAPSLSASCAATPTEGEAPLEVAFTLNVAGAQGPVSVTVTYGDGSSGSDPDATHVYGEEGLYTASFTVTSATQVARCSTPVAVSAGSAGTPGGGSGGGDDNLPPMATFKTTPDAAAGKITGAAPLAVRFNVCLTDDPESDTLYFTMDFNGDGKLDKRGSTGASCRGDWLYAMGTWTAEVCVTDIEPDGTRIHEFQCEKYKVVAS